MSKGPQVAKRLFVSKEGGGRVAEIAFRGRVVGNEVREVGRGQNLYYLNTEESH